MKRKLIDAYQEILIQCDNPKCNYKVKNITGDPFTDVSEYLNKPCPKCGKNLLTEEDYRTSLRLGKLVKWVNKWFSWLTYIFPAKNPRTIGVHVHKGINITEEN